MSPPPDGLPQPPSELTVQVCESVLKLGRARLPSLQAVTGKASICQQRLPAAFPAGFLPTDSLSDATSNVYDLTVDHHGTSTNPRLLKDQNQQSDAGRCRRREKDPYSWGPQVKTEHPIPPVDTSTRC